MNKNNKAYTNKLCECTNGNITSFQLTTTQTSGNASERDVIMH